MPANGKHSTCPWQEEKPGAIYQQWTRIIEDSNIYYLQTDGIFLYRHLPIEEKVDNPLCSLCLCGEIFFIQIMIS
jgi:hypothetical protein